MGTLRFCFISGIALSIVYIHVLGILEDFVALVMFLYYKMDNCWLQIEICHSKKICSSDSTGKMYLSVAILITSFTASGLLCLFFCVCMYVDCLRHASTWPQTIFRCFSLWFLSSSYEHLLGKEEHFCVTPSFIKGLQIPYSSVLWTPRWPGE